MPYRMAQPIQVQADQVTTFIVRLPIHVNLEAEVVLVVAVEDCLERAR